MENVNERLSELNQRMAEARQAIGSTHPLDPYGDFQDDPSVGYRCAWKILEAARASGKTPAELAAIVIRDVVPKVIEYRRRAFERDVAAYELVRKQLDDPSVRISAEDAPYDTRLGFAVFELQSGCEDDLDEAMRSLFHALDGSLRPEEWGPRLAEAVLDAIQAHSSDAAA